MNKGINLEKYKTEIIKLYQNGSNSLKIANTYHVSKKG